MYQSIPQAASQAAEHVTLGTALTKRPCTIAGRGEHLQGAHQVCSFLRLAGGQHGGDHAALPVLRLVAARRCDGAELLDHLRSPVPFSSSIWTSKLSLDEQILLFELRVANFMFLHLCRHTQDWSRCVFLSATKCCLIARSRHRRQARHGVPFSRYPDEVQPPHDRRHSCRVRVSTTHEGWTRMPASSSCTGEARTDCTVRRLGAIMVR